MVKSIDLMDLAAMHAIYSGDGVHEFDDDGLQKFVRALMSASEEAHLRELKAYRTTVDNLEAELSALRARCAELTGEVEHESKWRDLALQFDGHRMQALWHLREVLHADSSANQYKAAEQFLSSPPIDGEQVLAQRIAELAPQAALAAVPVGWREQFTTAVYEDLAAADNQDVPLEEYPARILKVLESIVGPRHPTVIKWRNDAIRSCIKVACCYCTDPESQKYLKQDLEAMLTAAPAHPAEGVPAPDVVLLARELSDMLDRSANGLEAYRDTANWTDADEDHLRECRVLVARADTALAATPAAGVPASATVRDEIQRLARFADCATRMNAPDMRNNMETLADELTKLMAATDAAGVPAAAPDAREIEAAAKRMAELFDYPWEQMPNAGRENMRKNARDIFSAAQSGKGDA